MGRGVAPQEAPNAQAADATCMLSNSQGTLHGPSWRERVMHKGQTLPRDQAVASPQQESSQEGQRPWQQARRALPAGPGQHRPHLPSEDAEAQRG